MAAEKTTPEAEAEEIAKPKATRKTSTAKKSGTATKTSAAKSGNGAKTTATKGKSATAKKADVGNATKTGNAKKSADTTVKTKQTVTKTGASKSTTTTRKKSTASPSSAAETSGAAGDSRATSVKKGTGTRTKKTEKTNESVSDAAKTGESENATITQEKPNDADAEHFADSGFTPISNVPIALPAGELIRAPGHEVSDAHPPLDFPAEMKRNFFLRVCIILVVLAILAISAFVYYNRPVRYVEKTWSVNFLYVPAQNQTKILVNGAERGAVEGTLSASSFNGRGDTCAAVIGGDLYLIRGKNIIHVAEDILDFVLAADGGALAYRADTSHLYYRETGKDDTPSLISKNCNSAAYCLSANGKELAYTALDDAGVSYLRVESYSSNRPYMENAAGLLPVAISNKSRYIYYTDADGALYVFDSEKSQKVKCGAAPDLTSLIFNRDFTEVLFTENGATVLFANGERRQIVGADSTACLLFLPNQRVASRALSGGTQYMLSSFYKNYFLHEVGTGKKLTYLDRKGNLIDVSFVDSAETVTVTDKGVYFLLTSVNGENVSRELYHVKAGKTQAARIEWGVSHYYANVDGSRVMFTGYEDALYVYRAETGTERLCDSIVADTLSVTADDLFCFCRAEGLLTVSDNGGELRDIATGVLHFKIDAHVLYFATEPSEDGTFQVYANYRNERLCELVATGVSKIE